MRAQDGALHVNLVLNDAFVAEYVAKFVRPEDQYEVAVQALATGFRAIAAAKTNGGLIDLSDKLQSSVAAASEHALNVTKAVDAKLDKVTEHYLGPDGQFSKVFDEFEKSIAAKFGPDSVEMHEFRERTRKDFAANAKAVVDDVRGLMNIADEKSPMGKVSRDIQGIFVKIAELTKCVEAQSVISRARGAIANVAGQSLEDFLAEIASPIASIHGETFDDVRNVFSTVVERSKVGDYVTTLDPAFTRGTVARVVHESKNRPKATVSGLLRELDLAMASRQAIVGIGISTNPNQKGRPITAYGGNKIIISLPGFGSPDCDYDYFRSLIEVGYEYGRLLAAARVMTPQAVEIDLGAIIGCVDELSEASSGFKQLADNLTRVETAIATTRTTATDMRDKFFATGKKLRGIIDAEMARIKSIAVTPPKTLTVPMPLDIVVDSESVKSIGTNGRSSP